MEKPEEQKAQGTPPLWIFALAFLTILLVSDFMQGTRVDSISYDAFEKYLAEGAVGSVRIGQNVIYGEYKRPKNGKTEFVTSRVEPELAQTLSRYGVEYSGVPDGGFLRQLMAWVAPALIFFAIWYFIARSIAARGGPAGMLTANRSRAKVYMDEDTGVTFEDVAGIDEAKEEMREIIEFLKNPREYERLGAHIPKGILLVGPPGTGKTLLARAIAGEARVPFFSISGSEFIELFVGMGAARVRDLFEQARKKAPSIIFIDELDALGGARGIYPFGGGHEEREQTLNQMLSEMDGFDTSEGVVILAATNRPEILDPALLRAGRFDRQVLVDNPDRKGRIKILEVHAKKIRLAEDVDLSQVAAITTGFSGADLANLVNEAAIQATRRKADAVTMADFTQAVERIVAGLEKRSRILTPFERKVVAYHEMGHALVALALPGVDVVHKVSIIPRGIGALGYTIQRPTEDRYIMTREELENKVTALLGGRAAEKLVFDHTSTGAADDLAKATDIVHSMVARYGMDEKLGAVAYEEPRSLMMGGKIPETLIKKYSETTARQIDEAVHDIVGEAFDRAVQILKDNRDLLEKGAKNLLKTETLEKDAIRELTRQIRKPKRGKQPQPESRPGAASS